MFAMQSTVFRRLAMAVAVVFTLAHVPVTPASAGMVSTDRIVGQHQAEEARATVGAFLAREDVTQELRAMGVDPKEAQARVATLSDAEAVQLADRIEDMPAGQGVLGGLIFAGLFIFLVLLITDLLGFTHVFGFTNKGAMNTN